MSADILAKSISIFHFGTIKKKAQQMTAERALSVLASSGSNCIVVLRLGAQMMHPIQC